MNATKQPNGSTPAMRRALIAAACLAAAACWTGAARGAEVVEEVRRPEIEEENVAYGKGGDRELKLDLARPEGDGPFPAIVFVHGGGWRGGSRAGYRREIVEAASPTTYVSKHDPPVLSLHGADDKLVPPDQARLLDEKMKAAGAPHTLMLLEGQGHGFRGEGSAEARAAMYAFFDKHLK